MSQKVYIIEDDNALCDELVHLLELQGFQARCCDDFSNAAQHALDFLPDCILLDLKLPNADGHAICRDIRASSDIPLIMLTSSDSEFDEVMALGLGADDYIIKPYRPATLIARIQGVLRRNSSSSAILEHEGVKLDEISASVEFKDNRAELTRNELKILQILMRNAGAVVSRQQIMYHLWESDEFIDDNTLTVNINRLRHVLTSLGVQEDFIKTRRGIGYSI